MILTVAFYDQETGDITEITSAPRASLVADRRPYYDVTDMPVRERRRLDSTHKVVVTDHGEELVEL